jgi:hypothetical protein
MGKIKLRSAAFKPFPESNGRKPPKKSASIAPALDNQG